MCFRFDGRPSKPVGRHAAVGHRCRIFLLMLKIARLAHREGRESLTVEQIAKLPQYSSNTVAVLWLILAFIILPL